MGRRWPIGGGSVTSLSSTGDVTYVPFSSSVWILISGMGLSGGIPLGAENWYEISFWEENTEFGNLHLQYKRNREKCAPEGGHTANCKSKLITRHWASKGSQPTPSHDLVPDSLSTCTPSPSSLLRACFNNEVERQRQTKQINYTAWLDDDNPA